MRYKKAQFYIIAAVIITIILLGLFATKNYIRVKPKDVKFYDLSKELNLESGYVIDHGIYNPTIIETDALIEKWARTYVDYSSKVTGIGEWIFVYGDEIMVDAIIFTNESSGSVYINAGSGSTEIPIPGQGIYKQEDISVEAGTKVVEIIAPDGIKYSFNLNSGENFFFILSKGSFVATPDVKLPTS